MQSPTLRSFAPVAIALTLLSTGVARGQVSAHRADLPPEEVEARRRRAAEAREKAEAEQSQRELEASIRAREAREREEQERNEDALKRRNALDAAAARPVKSAAWTIASAQAFISGAFPASFSVGIWNGSQTEPIYGIDASDPNAIGARYKSGRCGYPVRDIDPATIQFQNGPPSNEYARRIAFSMTCHGNTCACAPDNDGKVEQFTIEMPFMVDVGTATKAVEAFKAWVELARRAR